MKGEEREGESYQAVSSSGSPGYTVEFISESFDKIIGINNYERRLSEVSLHCPLDGTPGHLLLSRVCFILIVRCIRGRKDG
jgi:hypothetical protein